MRSGASGVAFEKASIKSAPLICTASDRFFDYCLQPYEPRESPAGKLRSENLLWLSFELAGLTDQLGPAIDLLQEHCGRDMAVFGVKHFGGKLFWELYYYDPKKEDATVTVTSVAAALAPLIKLEPATRESVPYFMFSFDLDAASAASGRVDGVNLYLAAREVQAGRSYKATTYGTEFENTYRFLHPKKDIEKILHGIKSSMFVDFTKVPLSKVLYPELFTCNRICVAKKRKSDALYFSGIAIDQFEWFLKRFDYPAAIIQYVKDEHARLSHLSFDVGIDYRANDRGEVVTGKTSFYGTF